MSDTSDDETRGRTPPPNPDDIPKIVHYFLVNQERNAYEDPIYSLTVQSFDAGGEPLWQAICEALRELDLTAEKLEGHKDEFKKQIRKELVWKELMYGVDAYVVGSRAEMDGWYKHMDGGGDGERKNGKDGKGKDGNADNGDEKGQGRGSGVA